MFIAQTSPIIIRTSLGVRCVVATCRGMSDHLGSYNMSPRWGEEHFHFPAAINISPLWGENPLVLQIVSLETRGLLADVCYAALVYAVVPTSK